MSERTALGAAQDTHGSRMKVSNELTLPLIAPRIFCWRRARVRSFSFGLHSLWRGGARAGRRLPLVSCVPPLPRAAWAPLFLAPLVRRSNPPPPLGGPPRAAPG